MRRILRISGDIDANFKSIRLELERNPHKSELIAYLFNQW